LDPLSGHSNSPVSSSHLKQFMVADRQVSSKAGMSALGQKRTLKLPNPMSALPPKPDIGTGPVSLDQPLQGLAHRVVEIGVAEMGTAQL
jgi:hypothetical protein